MKKLKSTLPNMVIVLTATTMIAGFLLGYVYSSTADARTKAENDKLTSAVSKVITRFDNDPIASKTTIEADGQKLTLYPAMDKEELIGCAVESSSDNGFSGRITIVVGFDRQCNILGYEVTSHAETPGLGSKMGEWFKAEGKGSIIGKNPTIKVLKTTKDKGEIDAITAATISSKAFLEAVNTAAKGAQQYYQQTMK